MRWPFADLWKEALPYKEFAEQAVEQKSLWTDGYRLAHVPRWAWDAAAELPERYRLVVLAEDWCSDGANTVPLLAKWAALSPHLELRILPRDKYPQVMDRYLTGGLSRSIPVVIVLNEDMKELGSWGPRPRALNTWVQEQFANGRAKQELLPEIRRWYIKDKGESVLREVLALMPEPALL